VLTKTAQLIKQLSATPTITAQNVADGVDAKAQLRANREVFFFRLEREIEKVNVFYLQKEAEFSLRLKTLLDKKRMIQARITTSAKISSSFATLVEGFQQFDNDLNKLQLFVEVNETAISKILKKWDKTSKSKTKELYLQRAVEIQPCFNRDVLRDLSDKATTARLDLEALAEGENVTFEIRPSDRTIGQRVGTEESDVDAQILQAASSGNLTGLAEWISRLRSSPDAKDRFTRIFLASINDATNEALGVLLQSTLVDIHAEDDINERNCLHEAAIYGKDFVLDYALQKGVDLSRLDVYGRIPLHYACLKGRYVMVQKLIAAGRNTVDFKDHDNFTPLIHSIIRRQLECVKELLNNNAQFDPASEADHVPLNLACQHGSVEVAILLLGKGARLLPDAEGLYPQHLVARSSDSSELLLLLKQHGADLNQRDKLYSWTPLFHAASEGRVQCLQTLLQSGADVNALDEKGLTALYYATWEGKVQCMNLLWERSGSRPDRRPLAPSSLVAQSLPMPSAMDYTTTDQSGEGDGIPDLSLPPPIIPLRRYGHNFLDQKTFISINFGRGANSIKFFNEARYPAARIQISSKMSDLIPRNLMLPIQDDQRAVSFQIDDLSAFAIDFEVYPTFGSKVIAKSVALPDIFQAVQSSSGSCCLPLFDPRLRAIGQISLTFQVIKPYNGVPLEITHFATYWKATSALDDRSGLITGSSLSGDYLQLAVQLSRDGIPIVYPSYTVRRDRLEVPVSQLTYDMVRSLQKIPQIASSRQLSALYSELSTSFGTLSDIISRLPSDVNLNIHLLYPAAEEEANLGVTSFVDINTFADAVLTIVFDHARALKARNPDLARSIVFSSSNPLVCSAFNWKQPNFPTLLCNNLGHDRDVAKSALSIKESARLAQNNNFMGLVCRSEILDMVPALIESIKAAGLVLVSDLSGVPNGNHGHSSLENGVNGIMKNGGVLTFNETIDM
jgi:CDK inhibitor PHO81